METAREQRDWATNVTVLSGDIDGNDITDPNSVVTDTANITGTNSYHVVTSSGVTETAVLDGFTITAGQANGVSPHDDGGGMYNMGSNPTLTNVIFSGNLADYDGGGMSNKSGSPTLTDVTFSGNSANRYGGGMFNLNGSGLTMTNVTFSSNSAYSGGGMFNSSSSPTLTDVAFNSNSADHVGGGMHNNGYSSPTLTSVTFSSNSADSGGGICNDGYSSPTLTDVTFSGNSANAGGGMYNSDSNPTLTNVTFSGNSANNSSGGMFNLSSNPTLTNVIFDSNSTNGQGGGMHNHSSSPVLTNVTFSGNTASQYGGGMLNESSSPGLTNITFSGNTANWDGGGISNRWSSSPILTNVTFSGNSANNQGGGMSNSDNSNPALSNVILWGNTAPNGASIWNDSSTPQISYGDIQDCGGSGSWDSACGVDGGGNIEADPLFVDAANGNLRLQDSSPAINAGNNAALPPGVLTDLDGNPRFVRVVVDLGAYENQTLQCPAGGVLYVDKDATGLETGESWNNAFVTLRDALYVTESCEIWVAAGTYKPTTGTDRTATFQLKDGVGVYGGFVGTETLLSQRDPATNITILSGDLNGDDNSNVQWDEPTRADNSSNVVIGATGATLDGFTITAGNANGTDNKYYGGGMYNMSSNTTLANITFGNNSAKYYGGGMYIENSSPMLTNVNFSGNDAANSGGGVYNHTSNTEVDKTL
jgi:predicted outer membrane repeat protein